ncbi:MAG TPA: hypothetical protein VLG67_01625 [Candidatus Saccharimonadales bacterium]|nr:hypothetical protein [Candidatus Saccharimonadales bacterium]
MGKYGKKEFLDFLISVQWQNGQSLLIVVLVMVVVLTVGLSVAVRSTTNIRNSTDDESSQKAFSAAEAGVEQALLNPTPIANTDLGNNASFSTSVSTLAGTQFTAHNGTTVLKDEPIDIWLANYPDYSVPWSGNLTVHWGQSGETCATSEANNTQAALEIVLISGSKAAPKLTEYMLDPCTPRRGANNFQTPSGSGVTISGKTFAYKQTVLVSSGLIARIIPLYAPTVIGIEGSVALPAQGTVVTSTGVSDNTKRKIVSFRGYPKLPTELFPFIFFSPK